MEERQHKYSDQEGEFLVKTAREAIVEWLKSIVKIPPPAQTPKSLYQKSGVFVTLTSTGTNQLRGCIGYPLPLKPLIEAVIEVAIQAATQDPRFPPVRLEEAKTGIKVEVSVLTKPVLIKVDKPQDYPKCVIIGEDGLIVERGYNSGLLLPQVATEWNMTSEEFLSHCCLKAGLPPDEWLSEDVKISKFRAEVFAEEEPCGRVYRKILTDGKRLENIPGA